MFLKKFRRLIKKTVWYDLRSTKPISNKFGLDRGLPIDRYYIEKFLSENSKLISGKVLEVAESTYSKKFGTNIGSIDILHYEKSNKNATIIGDLTKSDTLPEDTFDCFICTQTLNFIYDLHSAVDGIKRVLKPGGNALITLAGICQVSRYDMDRWGDYWRFTTDSAKNIFSEKFGSNNISVDSYGNVLAAVSLLEGISVEELTSDELNYQDKDYQVVISVIARKEL